MSIVIYPVHSLPVSMGLVCPQLRSRTRGNEHINCPLVPPRGFSHQQKACNNCVVNSRRVDVVDVVDLFGQVLNGEVKE
jgi:hypothetical protein